LSLPTASTACLFFSHPTEGNYYKQQLLAIDWATDPSNPLSSRINASAGFGIAGHSMGGQATLYSSSAGNIKTHDIRAAVMHHPFTHSYPKPAVPYIVFTGAEDEIATPAMAEAIYSEAGGDSPFAKAIANKLKSGHHAPDTLGFDPLLPQFTAAWFKLFLDGEPTWNGIAFDEMIFGRGPASICNGGFGEMVESMCEAVPPVHH
jgi:hypothetical protein